VYLDGAIETIINGGLIDTLLTHAAVIPPL